MGDYKSRLLKSIPGGAHTYSRGHDQYPKNAPEILRKGKGVYVYKISVKSTLTNQLVEKYEKLVIL